MRQKLRKTSLYLGYFGLLLLACVSYNALFHPTVVISENANNPQASSTLAVSATLLLTSDSQVLSNTTAISSSKRLSTEPDIPKVIKQRYFGVPAGNGYDPRQIAVDSQNYKVYTFNYGLFGEGNTISVLDTELGEIEGFLKLNNHQGTYNPKVRALEIDPYRPRLYAIWEIDGIDNLTIINTETLTIAQTISNVVAITSAPDKLYLANDTRLWTVDIDSSKILIERELEIGKMQGPLLFNPIVNRLYLVRDKPNLIEVFTADTLTPLETYEIDGRFISAAIDIENDQLLVVERNGQFTLKALDSNGKFLNNQFSFAGNIHPNLITKNGKLFVIENANKMTQLDVVSLPDLIQIETIPLTFYPGDFTFDPLGGHFYATSSNESILEFNPETGDSQEFFTYLSVIGALVDLDTNRLYVLNQQGTLRVLDSRNGNGLAKIETGSRLVYDFDFTYLSLDPSRERLYIDTGWYSKYIEGNQLLVVDTYSLTLTHNLDLRGQVSPDPASNRIYLSGKSCGVQIINADTWAETGMIFPFGDQEPPPPMGPCIRYSNLDSLNQILYAVGSYCSGGSSCGGLYSSIYDVSGKPEYISNIRNKGIGFDSEHNRVFTSDYDDYASLSRFKTVGGIISQTHRLFGAGDRSRMFYDSEQDRLYTSGGSVFDGDLTLLVEPNLPGQIVAFNPKEQLLYARDRQGYIYIIATNGGELQPPPQNQPEIDNAQWQELFTTSDGTYFGIYDGSIYRSYDKGKTWQRLGQGLPDREVETFAISPDYKRDHTLLISDSAYGYGGIFRSTNGGDTWWPTTQGLTSIFAKEIVFSPTFARDQTIFIITAEHDYTPNKLSRSDDGGKTWTSLGSILIPDASYPSLDHLVLSPNFADDKLALINFKEDLLRSTDGGDSWNATIITKPSRFQAISYYFSPDFADDRMVYVLLKHRYDSEYELQRSTDAGQTWQPLVGEMPVDFEYTIVVFQDNGNLYFKADDGQDFTLPLTSLTWKNVVQ